MLLCIMVNTCFTDLVRINKFLLRTLSLVMASVLQLHSMSRLYLAVLFGWSVFMIKVLHVKSNAGSDLKML